MCPLHFLKEKKKAGDLVTRRLPGGAHRTEAPAETLRFNSSLERIHHVDSAKNFTKKPD